MGDIGNITSGNFLGYLADPLDVLGSRASGRAIDAQTAAAGQANDTQRYMYDSQRSDSAPWRQAGGAALSELSGNKFMDNFQGDPGYQFRMSEGLKAVGASASARGMSNSGRNLKELTRYGQDYASNEYNNAYNRQSNRLSSIAGLGQNANQQNSAAGTNYANQVAGNQIGLGNGIASANLAQSNRQGQLVGQGAQAAMMFSDSRLKINVLEVRDSDLLEMKESLRAFTYKYKDEIYGKGQWTGVMAQDLEKSKLGKTLVFEDSEGNKQIDVNKVMSLFLATMAEG